MNTRKGIPFLHLIFTIEFLILIQSQYISTISDEEYYQTCGKTFNCGDNITDIGYPFRGSSDPQHCGHPNLVLDCNYQKNNVTNIEIMGLKYRVLEIEQATQTMTIAREDIMEEACPSEMKNTTLDYSTFDFAAVYLNITFLYGCPPGGHEFKDLVPVSCGNNNGDGDQYVLAGTFGPRKCRDSVIVPAPVPGDGAQFPDITELDRIMRQGFLVRWKIGSQLCSNCTMSEGRCGYSLETNQTVCYCRNPPYVTDVCTIPSSESTVGERQDGTIIFVQQNEIDFGGLDLNMINEGS